MATKNLRITITLEKTTVQLLKKLAKQKRLSVSRLGQELILEVLARQEEEFVSVSLKRQVDQYFSARAEAHDAEKKSRVSHKNAWKSD